MDLNTMGDSLELWPLPSGAWAPSGDAPGFTLTSSTNGHHVSGALGAADIAELLRTGRHPANANAMYPPEFRFCSVSGARLVLPEPAPPAAAWIPPFGVSPMAVRTNRAVRGLQQTMAPLMLDRRSSRRPDLDPDAELQLPPHGDYEFFSIPAATLSSVLLGLDAVKGMMYLWLPGAKRWEQLEHVDGGHLAVASVSRSRWRCEASCEGLNSILFLPTEEGLACVRPDTIGLRYHVSYLGGSPVVGAPVQFSDQVWAPLAASGGTLKFLGATIGGDPAEVIEYSPPVQADWTSEPCHPPLADGRMALWPHVSGQLVLRKQASGALDARFIRWPGGMRPVFELGSAFLARDGGFWQLCFDSAQDSYVYLQLGVECPEIYLATAPRLCTGSFNFRFAAKYRTSPWHEPEHGDDSGTDQVVLPLLESVANSAVVGLRMATTQGLADVLKSSERIRVEFVLDDDITQTVFHTLSVAEPWRMRMFLHDGRLWAYHPLMSRMEGWDLQA